MYALNGFAIQGEQVFTYLLFLLKICLSELDPFELGHFHAGIHTFQVFANGL